MMTENFAKKSKNYITNNNRASEQSRNIKRISFKTLNQQLFTCQAQRRQSWSEQTRRPLKALQKSHCGILVLSQESDQSITRLYDSSRKATDTTHSKRRDVVGKYTVEKQAKLRFLLHWKIDETTLPSTAMVTTQCTATAPFDTPLNSPKLNRSWSRSSKSANSTDFTQFWICCANWLNPDKVQLFDQ